jgi:hypothetical protein
MVDFSKLLDKSAGEAKKPPVLPEGIYTGVVKGYQIGDNNKNKTPYVRFALGYIEAMEGVSIDGIDLAKRQGRSDFFLTEDALYRLDEFLKSIGVDPNGKTYREALPEATGASVKIEVGHFVNQSTGELGDLVKRVWGEST